MDPPDLPFTTEGVDDMTMAEYLRSQRVLTEEQVHAAGKVHSQFDASAEDVYEAHSHHEEYGHAFDV